MNALTRDLMCLVKAAEDKAAGDDCFRQKLHLMPPVGWLNDPNGLCQFHGLFHAFYQYSPFNAEGGLKMWGHCTSPDMLVWHDEGVALYPDQPFDCHGVYSGSALIEDGKMYLYYTGNVKLEDGDFDYIRNGREANTVMTVSEDGYTFSAKKVVMRNHDYPSDLTCHVRDPKVFRANGKYYMVQGARDYKDTGKMLIFESGDKIHWTYKNAVSTKLPFGYMWECPDYFEIDGIKVISASVQGLKGGLWDDRNVYQSGYFIVNGDILGECSLSEYHLWDDGFDYYAPQSFETEDGRRIHISWMGMPDCEAYTNKTLKDGWQHCFTFPREIHVKDGKLLQKPVRELEAGKLLMAEAQSVMTFKNRKVYMLEVGNISDNRFRAVLSEDLILEYKDGRFEMYFKDCAKSAVSAGRSLRYAQIHQLTAVTILADVSSVEVFINDGEHVFSTRYYPEKYQVSVQADGAKIKAYEIKI